MKKHGNRAAMRFASAGYLSRQRMLSITFEDGDCFLVAVESILPASSNGKSSSHPDWSRMRISETNDVLELPAGSDVIEIPWDRIRSIADADFRSHLADRAVERARQLGERIRTMRLESGLTRATVAEKVGITREGLADLEKGKYEPHLELLERIAQSLSKRLSDFADVPAKKRPQRLSKSTTK